MMAFVITFAKTVRTHWKKSIFFTGVAVYGVKYAKEKYEDDQLRRKYCAEAKVYGEQAIDLGGRSRRITVFLNPAANGGKGKKLFEKNAAPLLYLAGLEVNVVKTEYDGQVKEFLKVFDKKHADAIVVAAGNGVLLETLTGVMRKEDKGFRQKIAMGVIPVGATNTFASFFYGSEKADVRRMLDSAMAVVKGITQKIDVLKIQGEDGKSTYALCGLEAGGYRDAKERASKYWYFGPLKHRFTYFRTTLSTWPPNIKGTMEYVLATESDGTTRKVVKKVAEKPKPSTWSWKNLFYSPRNNRKVMQAEEEEEEEEDDDTEDDWVKKDMSAVELTISSRFTTTEQKTLKGVEVGLGPENPVKGDFKTEGWGRRNRSPWQLGSKNNDTFVAKKFKFTLENEEGQEMWYTIDGEHYEARPVTVTLLPNRLKMFTIPDNTVTS